MKLTKEEVKPVTPPTVQVEEQKKSSPITQPTKTNKEDDKIITTKSDEKSKVLSWVNSKCYHYWFTSGAMAQKLIQYACEVSKWDIDFILTLNAENWSRDHQTQSRVIQKNWVREPSFGMCQVHWWYHKKTIYEWLPLSRVKESKFLSDWKYQIETCYSLYKKWVPMYWYNNRYKVLKWLIDINWKRY